ncbi:MAG: hypothetical protein COX66_09660, partial [Elusimicrobia bacterium CG_4_10_14_0_2_um_filter_63_34]
KAIEEGAIKLAFDSFGKIVVDPIAGVFKTLAEQMMEPGGAGPKLVQCFGGTGGITDSYIQSSTRGCSNGTGWVKLPGAQGPSADPNCTKCSVSGGSSTPTGGTEQPAERAPGRVYHRRPDIGTNPAGGTSLKDMCEWLAKGYTDITDPELTNWKEQVIKPMRDNAKVLLDVNGSVFAEDANPGCGVTKTFKPGSRDFALSYLGDNVSGVLDKDVSPALEGLYKGSGQAAMKAAEAAGGVQADPVDAQLGGVKDDTEQQKTYDRYAAIQKYKYDDQKKALTDALGLAKPESMDANIKTVTEKLPAVIKAHSEVAAHLETLGTKLGDAHAAINGIAPGQFETTNGKIQKEQRDLAVEYHRRMSEIANKETLAMTQAKAKAANLGAYPAYDGGERTAIGNARASLASGIAAYDAAHLAIGNPEDGSALTKSPRGAGIEALSAVVVGKDGQGTSTLTIDGVPLPSAQPKMPAAVFEKGVQTDFAAVKASVDAIQAPTPVPSGGGADHKYWSQPDPQNPQNPPPPDNYAKVKDAMDQAYTAGTGLTPAEALKERFKNSVQPGLGAAAQNANAAAKSHGTLKALVPAEQ